MKNPVAAMVTGYWIFLHIGKILSVPVLWQRKQKIAGFTWDRLLLKLCYDFENR